MVMLEQEQVVAFAVVAQLLLQCEGVVVVNSPEPANA
jgi:hypothetical protein